MPRPYRIELGQRGLDGQSDPNDGRLDVMNRLRAAAQPDDAAATAPGGDMWGVLGEIQSRLENVKTEISALRTSAGPSRVTTGHIELPETNQSRNAEELHDVITAMESATNTILAAAEDVGEVAEILAAEDNPAMEEHAEALLNAMVTIYQACNFQDISGQRLVRVITSLSLIDSKVTDLVDSWRSGEAEAPLDANGDPDALLNGPARETDENVVSQNDIDALFG